MEIKQFKGLRNTSAEERFPVGYLLDATNLDLDDTGKPLSRRGYEQVSATALHSLYSNHAVTLAAAGSSLVRVNPDYSLTTLAALGSSAPVSYDTVGNTAYYSNGVTRGKVVGTEWQPWGVTPPAGQPAAAAITGGTLPAGRYLYAMTFLRDDGHESGTGVSGQIDLSSAGGIRFTGMEVSTNSLIRDKILYLSGTNGEVLFKVAQVPNAQDAVDVLQSRSTVPLQTQFRVPPPAGTIVRHFGGSMMVAAADAVFYSDPHELELFRMDTSYLRVPGSVSLLEGVNDGLFVATADAASGDDSESTGATWYAAGSTPHQLKLVRVFDHGAVPGTAVRTEAGFLDATFETDGMQGRPAVIWVSRFGLCAGYDGGTVRNYTEARYSLPAAQRGAGMVRQERGYVQYVVALQGVGAANNAYSRG